MTYLMTILDQNFGELGEETALKATLDLLRFPGRPGENVDAMLARFDEVSARAAEDGQLRLNTPSRGCNAPFSGRCNRISFPAALGADKRPASSY